ncbi:MAG: hypothetical protein M3354_09200, partial [Chloroflexota bacterium]|nr:hypothetical protein [Chloroflexota bacterium]
MDPEARDGALGVFAQATDPERMRLILERHLQLPGGPPVEVVVCEVAFARRGTSRGLFQYRVTLRDPAGGGHRDEVVTGVAYGGQRTLRAWDKLQRHHRPALADGALVARAAYVPELDLLLQVFPFDHQLPALELLMAGPWAPLVAPLLTRFGPGDWRLEGWNTEIVRYRVDLRACVRLVVRASEGGTGRTAERRFFAKIYGNASLAHQAWDGQRRLAAALATDDAALATAPLAVYLQDERVLVQDEVSGACLRDTIRKDDGCVEAVRRTARALAGLHCLAVAAPA